MKFTKYKKYPKVNLTQRQWVNNTIDKAPIWCSVDLRDGNQALEVPMTLEQKIDFFKYLIEIGFKEIEIGFPAASDTEYEFTRYLIDNDLIPDDVTIQVLTQSREHIIRKTFEALQGAKNAIIHLYNSTSTLQRDVVFNFTKEETINLAVFGAKLITSLAKEYNCEHFRYEYSPESFTGTELDFATEIIDAVSDVFCKFSKEKLIINLPATVEMSTPNIYADQVEYICTNIRNRDNIIISLHTHNDRGTAIAASELGVLAGADRVEGTLFGNGERTGNADLLVMAMNLFSQGVDPQLDFSNIDDIVDVYKNMTNLGVHQRHPYAGDLVYTAFSGSHQDAINKGLKALKDKEKLWEVPYLPIDPMDVGRNYDPIIRINSQSGKGGVAFVLQTKYGLIVPKVIQQDFSKIITALSDKMAHELSVEEIYNEFNKEYVNIEAPIKLNSYIEETKDKTKLLTNISFKNEQKEVIGYGDGVIEAFCDSLIKLTNKDITILDYSEHALSVGSKSSAVTYVSVKIDDKTYFGVGISANITKSSFNAISSALNKSM